MCRVGPLLKPDYTQDYYAVESFSHREFLTRRLPLRTFRFLFEPGLRRMFLEEALLGFTEQSRIKASGRQIMFRILEEKLCNWQGWARQKTCIHLTESTERQDVKPRRAMEFFRLHKWPA